MCNVIKLAIDSSTNKSEINKQKEIDKVWILMFKNKKCFVIQFNKTSFEII